MASETTDTDTLEGEADGYVPFMNRFKAWWNGTEVEIIKREIPATTSNKARMKVDAPPDPEADKRWPKARIEINKRLWGEGFHLPGGSKYMLDFVKPLALNKEMTVIDIATGFGGGTVDVARKYGLWTAGCERDEELVSVAKGTCVTNDMEARVQIKKFDPSSFEMPEMKFHRIFMREAMFSFPNKAYVLDVLKSALRAQGELLFTDFVLADRSNEHDDVIKWREEETYGVTMWTAEDYQKAFQGLKMDVRVMQDDSENYKNMVLEGWKKFMRDLSKDDLTRKFVDAMILEGEFWQRRLKALETGQVRLMRIHTILPQARAMNDALHVPQTGD